MPKPQFFSVIDFDKLQHYKHRSPPWIKLYADLWEKPEFELLSDVNKAHFLGICILASKNNNRIPHDLAWIERHISATNPLDLNILFASKLLAPCKHSASKMLSQSRVEKSREETEQRRVRAIPTFQSIPQPNSNGHRPLVLADQGDSAKDDPEERAEAKRVFEAHLAVIAQQKAF